MDEDDEDVVFSNSPLDQYLKDVGFNDFESEPLNIRGPSWQESENGNLVATRRTRNERHAKDETESSFLGRIKQTLANPELWQSKEIRSQKKEYVEVVMKSDIVNVDDWGFLQRFDPDFFEDETADYHEQKLPHSLRKQALHQDAFALKIVSAGLLSFSVCLGVILHILFPSLRTKAVNEHLATALNTLLIVAMPLAFILWEVQHKWHKFASLHATHIKVLQDYCNTTKSFLLRTRKCINLIQEVELISRGQTFVGTGMPIGRDITDESSKKIYPKLRHYVLENLNAVFAQSCAEVNILMESCPRCPELVNVFTTISTASMEILGLDDSDEESTHYLKTLFSVTACQQSEFLSYFLLSLSDKAQDTGRGEYLNKLLTAFDSPLKVVTNSLRSLERSYHLHNCAVSFSGNDGSNKKRWEPKPQSQWTPFYTALHSLELHLKAGITKVQSLQEKITEMQSVNDTESREYSEMKAEVSLIKGELNSATSCIEEGHYRLNVMFGKVDTVGNNSSDADPAVDDIQCTDDEVTELMATAEDEEGDYVLEAYTDTFDEVADDQPILTKEDLERESRAREENKHLLVELKNVLHTKSKDPLISEEGFVKPSKKPVLSYTENQSCLGGASKHRQNAKEAGYSELEGDKRLPDDLSIQEASSTGNWQQIGLPVLQPKYHNEESAVAFSAAAMAAVRSRSMGMMEEQFGSDDSDE